MLILAALSCWTLPARAAPPPGDDLIGVPTPPLVTRYSDTLLDIAVDHDIGFVAIRAANPGVDPWLPGAGKTLAVPTRHIFPDAPRRGIVINLPELRLYYFPPNGAPRTFPIGIGGEGKETPLGHTSVVRKKVHPTWIPTKSEHEDDPDLPAVVGPGPDNPMGDYALYLRWTGYAIHGTNKVYSIGRRDSHGCVRLYPDDIAWLFQHVPLGTPVTVVDQPAKLGWKDGELYLEIHHFQDDADSLERTGRPLTDAPLNVDQLVLKAAGNDAGRLDWDVIRKAEHRRDGVVYRITEPRSARLD